MERRKTLFTNTVLILFCMALLLTFGWIWKMNGYLACWNAVLFPSNSDTFMDLFHPMEQIVESPDPYSIDNGMVIYPPFAVLFFKFYERFLPNVPAIQMRALQAGQMLVVLRSVALLLPMAYLLYRKLEIAEWKRVLLVCCLLLSAPLLFLIERGNLLLETLLFALIFLFFYDSEKPLVRELAYLSLAAAASMKLYPAVLGFLVVWNRPWRDTLRLCLYGLAFFFLPFFCFHGVETMRLFVRDLMTAADIVELLNQIGQRVDLSAVTTVTGLLFHGDPQAWYDAAAVLRPVLAAMLIPASWFYRRTPWKSALCLVLLLVLLPSFNFIYAAVFYLPVLALLLTAHQEMTRLDFVYGLLLCACLLPMPFVFHENFMAQSLNRPMPGYVLVTVLSELALSLLLPVEAIVRILRRKAGKATKNAAISPRQML